MNTESSSLSSTYSFEKITSTQFRNNPSCGIQAASFWYCFNDILRRAELFVGNYWRETQIRQCDLERERMSTVRRQSRGRIVSRALKGRWGTFYGDHKYYVPTSGGTAAPCESASRICGRVLLVRSQLSCRGWTAADTARAEILCIPKL